MKTVGVLYANASTPPAVLFPTPGSRASSLRVAGTLPLMTAYDFFRRLFEKFRAAIITKSAPFFEYSRERRVRERLDSWESF